MATINIARDFSRTPGARYISDGPYSGELFRTNHLEPLFRTVPPAQSIVIELDGTAGFATSFLEESFGGLVRKFGSAAVMGKIEFRSLEDPSLIHEIQGYMSDAEKA